MSAATEIRRAAIIGGGSIGTAWAVVFARAGVGCTVFEPDPARRDAASGEIAEHLDALSEFGLLKETPQAIGARIEMAQTLVAAASGADWVQECAPEDARLKAKLFAEIGAITNAATVLASSSSAIPISASVPDVTHQRRALVAHPGNPPTLLPVVEIVPGPATEPAAVEAATAFMARCGMSPVRVAKEIEGFVYNRLQGAVLREAYCLVRDGVVEPDDIDRVVREGLGLRWSVVGPFETVDLNTRGGIAAHAKKMGPAYARMGAERGQDDPWTPDLVDRVAAARRAMLLLESWDERRGWRDRMLMAVIRAKRDALARFGI